jgi:hypothetical protein
VISQELQYAICLNTMATDVCRCNGALLGSVIIGSCQSPVVSTDVLGKWPTRMPYVGESQAPTLRHKKFSGPIVLMITHLPALE